MNLIRTEPLVNEFREPLRNPGGDIEVSLERLKFDLRYGGFSSRDFLRLIALYLMLFLRKGTSYA